MKRQIKFRGKRNNGQWVYGGLCRRWNDKPCIVAYNPEERDDDPGSYEDNWDIYVDVYEDTIGQFTGSHDKNGTEIYEGDIILCKDKYIYSIEWTLDGFYMINKRSGGVTSIKSFHPNQLEIIGNIHDTPSLISEKQ